MKLRFKYYFRDGEKLKRKTLFLVAKLVGEMRDEGMLKVNG